MLCCLLMLQQELAVRANHLPTLASDTHHCSLTISTIFPLFFFASIYSCASLQSDSLNCLSIIGFISPVENLSPAKDVKSATMVSLNCLGRARIVLPIICSLLPKHCSQQVSSAKYNVCLSYRMARHGETTTSKVLPNPCRSYYVPHPCRCCFLDSGCCVSRRQCTMQLGKRACSDCSHSCRQGFTRASASQPLQWCRHSCT